MANLPAPFIYPMSRHDHEIIAVDLDGTLAEYQEGDSGKSPEIGDPIPAMLEKVKQALAAGSEVWIFTGRITPFDNSYEQNLEATQQFVLIAQWCEHYLGQMLPITNIKLRVFSQFWDDKGKEVIPNTGVFLSELAGAAQGQTI